MGGRLYKLKDVAMLLGGVCVKTVRREIMRGRMSPVVRVGRLVCVPESTLKAYHEQRKQEYRP